MEAARLGYLSDVACLRLKQTCEHTRVLRLVNPH